jgi:hypothetical protein
MRVDLPEPHTRVFEANFRESYMWSYSRRVRPESGSAPLTKMVSGATSPTVMQSVTIRSRPRSE